MEKDAEASYIPVAPSPGGLSSAAPQPAPNSDLIKSTFEVNVTVADQQGDPNSPLYSAKTFEELGLHDDLLEGIYDMGFTKPSEIQERALPLLLSDPPTNMIGQSQPSTGNTAAFVLTMLSRVEFSKPQPQALCLVPSRELARQIMSVVVAIGKFTPVQTEYAIRDNLARDPGPIKAHIVVGTPGTMTDLIRRRILDPSGVKVLVLDQADNMLDQEGLGDQTLRVKNQLPREGIQIIVFSATFPDRVLTFASQFAPKANRMELKRRCLEGDMLVEGICVTERPPCYIERLSNEVLMEILRHSVLTEEDSLLSMDDDDQPTIPSLAPCLVCRRWELLAQPFLYRTVFIHDDGSDDGYINVLPQQPHLWKYVRSVWIAVEFLPADALALASMLSDANVEILSISTTLESSMERAQALIEVLKASNATTLVLRAYIEPASRCDARTLLLQQVQAWLHPRLRTIHLPFNAEELKAEEVDLTVDRRFRLGPSPENCPDKDALALLEACKRVPEVVVVRQVDSKFLIQELGYEKTQVIYTTTDE